MYRWQSNRIRHSAAIDVPTDSGVYVLIDNNRINGIPIDNRVLYVGKSINLRRRFLDYSNPKKVHNELVGEKLFNGDVEFWCTKIVTENLDNVERKFINEFKAPMNKIKYREYNNERSN